MYKSESFDKADAAIRALGDLKVQTTRNLNDLLKRDEKLDTLMERANDINIGVVQLKKKTVTVKRKSMWTGIKFKVMMAFVVVVSDFLLLVQVVDFFSSLSI